MRLLALITMIFVVYVSSGKLADFGENSPAPDIQQQEQVPTAPVVDPYETFKKKIDTISCNMLFELRDTLLIKHSLRSKKSTSYLTLINIVIEKAREEDCKEGKRKKDSNVEK